MIRKARNAMLWSLFDKVDDRIAKCKFCEIECSYERSTSKLVQHLKCFHRAVYNKISPAFYGFSAPEVVEYSEDNSTNVWSYYRGESENSRHVECVVCGVSVARDEDEASTHLKEKHPKLIAEDSDDEKITQTVEEEEVFSEVVYLEDDNPLNIVKKETPKPQRRPKAEKRRKTTREVRISTSSDEPTQPITKPLQNNEAKSQPRDELDKFGTYMMSLLRSVPSDVCTKLQMDIINLIMAEKLKLTQKEQRIMVEHVPMTISGTSYVVMPATSAESVTVSCNN